MNALPIPNPTLSDASDIRPMLLVNNLDFGGAQTAVFNLAIGLMGLGCAPLVLAWKRGGPLEERFRSAGIMFEVPGTAHTGWGRIGIPKLLRQAVARHRINVVHAHMSDSAAWAAVLQHRGQVPCLVTHHTTDLIDTVGIGRPLYGWARRRLLSLCSRAVAHNIAVSGAVRERLMADSHIAGGHVTVIENGLPLPSTQRVSAASERRRARAGHGFAAGGPLVLALGRLTREKGFDTLIEAAPAIRAVYPQARFRIVGDGPHRSALLETRARLGLEEIVELPGFVTDVGPLLEEADVLAAPSQIEGLPMAVLEAMSWAVPVAVSDIPAHRELVSPGSTGLTFPVADAAALADALLRTLSDACAAGERTARALDNVRERYSAKATALRHITAYRALVGAAR